MYAASFRKGFTSGHVVRPPLPNGTNLVGDEWEVDHRVEEASVL